MAARQSILEAIWTAKGKCSGEDLIEIGVRLYDEAVADGQGRLKFLDIASAEPKAAKEKSWDGNGTYVPTANLIRAWLADRNDAQRLKFAVCAALAPFVGVPAYGGEGGKIEPRPHFEAAAVRHGVDAAGIRATLAAEAKAKAKPAKGKAKAKKATKSKPAAPSPRDEPETEGDENDAGDLSLATLGISPEALAALRSRIELAPTSR